MTTAQATNEATSNDTAQRVTAQRATAQRATAQRVTAQRATAQRAAASKHRATSGASNKPVLPTAHDGPNANPLDPMRRQTGQPLGSLEEKRVGQRPL